MKYADIYPFDISNGPGIRVSLFVQGCEKHCKGCFNPETWDFEGGNEFIVEERTTILKLCEPDYISGLSILGGEPLHPNNIQTITDLCVKFKSKYPNKTIWIWTGYTMEELEEIYIMDSSYSIIKSLADVIIDGPFVEAEKDLTLKWRGSRNQRIWKRNQTTWIQTDSV